LEGKPFDLSVFDTVVIAAPVWAGFPAPAFNTIVDMVPADTDVEVLLVSGSGNTSRAKRKVIDKLKKRELNIVGYTDVKA
jgi:hypothetical protein